MSEAAGSGAPGAARPPRLPLSLILDDCAPINAAYFMHPEQEHVLSIPNSFADEFAAVCETHGVLGKYSVLPMPSGAGRIDRRVSYVAPSDLERFLDIVRSRLAVRFDITAEILTHLAAYDIDNDRLLHRYEDEWNRHRQRGGDGALHQPGAHHPQQRRLAGKRRHLMLARRHEQ